jgi:hypothetical protein
MSAWASGYGIQRRPAMLPSGLANGLAHPATSAPEVSCVLRTLDHQHTAAALMQGSPTAS